MAKSEEILLLRIEVTTEEIRLLDPEGNPVTIWRDSTEDMENLVWWIFHGLCGTLPGLRRDVTGKYPKRMKPITLQRNRNKPEEK